VGASGCGKSTLLRLIAGLEPVSRGEIWLGSKLINDLPPKARNMAMVFQSYALYPHLTVYDNIAFGLRRQPRSQSVNIDHRVRSVTKLLQIDHLLTRKPKDLSGGQKQRVALGRAIAREPQLFLMDEPLSNLDAQLRTDTRTQIVQLQKQLGTTTIYVTHDQVEAMTMGDRIAVLQGGKLPQVDSPINLYQRPANQFIASFLGTPKINFLPACRQDNLLVSPYLHTALELTPAQAQTLPCGEVIIGIRPEHLRSIEQDSAHLVTTIQALEVLGAETIILGTCEDVALRVKLTGAVDYHLYRSGHKAGWQIQTDKLLFFHPSSSLRVEI
jgi:multiple sugar transport system ATP-binding protein